MKTIKKVNVSNMCSSLGQKVPNQFEIKTENGVYFQSYGSIIVFEPKDTSKKTVLDSTYWDYSTTTGRYRNQFLCETKKETEQKIKDGVYLLKNLN